MARERERPAAHCRKMCAFQQLRESSPGKLPDIVLIASAREKSLFTQRAPRLLFP
jgi:hypothetical protein